MKLLDEIVDTLSSEDGSLTNALLKTKVLMHKIGYAGLAEWVTDELNGYGKGKQVPDYRIVPSRLYGHVANIARALSNIVLPTNHLPDYMKKTIDRSELRDSISVLERLAASPQGHLAVPVGPEYHQFVDQALDGFFVQKMWIQLEPTQVLHCLTEIRSRLLDFVLSLQDKLGDVKDGDVKQAAKSFDAQAMFKGAVFGDNTPVIVGDGNTTTITNTVKKGDLETLAAYFKQAGVSDGDVAELKKAVTADGPQPSGSQGGSKVRAWTIRMMGKAVDGTWAVGLGVAGELVAEGLKQYFGG